MQTVLSDGKVNQENTTANEIPFHLRTLGRASIMKYWCKRKRNKNVNKLFLHYDVY